MRAPARKRPGDPAAAGNRHRCPSRCGCRTDRGRARASCGCRPRDPTDRIGRGSLRPRQPIRGIAAGCRLRPAGKRTGLHNRSRPAAPQRRRRSLPRLCHPQTCSCPMRFHRAKSPAATAHPLPIPSAWHRRDCRTEMRPQTPDRAAQTMRPDRAWAPALEPALLSPGPAYR